MSNTLEWRTTFLSGILLQIITYLNFRINPNLYETGNVCLSLLGTWSGKEDSEEWTCNSNLLQLVVSIQGTLSKNARTRPKIRTSPDTNVGPNFSVQRVVCVQNKFVI